jgi:hypothetical protein
MKSGNVREPSYDSVVSVEKVYVAKVGPSPLRR